MKKLLLCLFVIGLGIALFNFQGLAAQGTFESIVLDFRENVANSVLQQDIQAIAQQYHAEPHLNSRYSVADHVYIIKGDAQVLAALKKSTLAKDTEFIEPNYIYSLPKSETATAAAANPAFTGPNDPLYSQQ
nr:peptidase S8 [Nostocaceae cyanobacterium]